RRSPSLPTPAARPHAFVFSPRFDRPVGTAEYAEDAEKGTPLLRVPGVLCGEASAWRGDFTSPIRPSFIAPFGSRVRYHDGHEIGHRTRRPAVHRTGVPPGPAQPRR